MKRTLLLVAVVVLLVGAACSNDDKKTTTSSSSTTTSSSSGAASSSSGTADANVITIKGFAFSGPASIKAGKVTIKNEDSTRHTFTPDDAGAFQSLELNGGDSGEVDLAPGTYSYHCNIHSSMKGTIEVTA